MNYIVVFLILINPVICSASLIWELDTGYIPSGTILLCPTGTGNMNIFIPLGENGLGGWTGHSSEISGFPISSEAGVFQRPAGCYSPFLREHVVVYPDNEGWLHTVDHRGNSMPGWPVYLGDVCTGITIVDLNDDGTPEITFGTSDGFVHRLAFDGTEYSNWPVQLESKLQWQPGQVLLNRRQANGLVCSLASTDILILDEDGSIIPGWPLQPGYTSASIPVTGDINSNGTSDVVFSTANKRLYVVSNTGTGLDGWPYFLDDNSVYGSIALGMTNPDASGIQIAVSTRDELVTLLDYDGSLIGSWKWPNRTDGKPTTPIITEISGNMVVLAGTDRGIIHAWNHIGESVSGFPIDFDQPISTTPAMGDILGNGELYLIVLGRAGKLSLYHISSLGSVSGTWPQMLCNERNTGQINPVDVSSFSTETVAAEMSGNIVFPYDLGENVVTSKTLEWSQDAGFSWQQTFNFTDTGYEIIWNSEKDLPGEDVFECALKLTPYSVSGSGVSAISNVFHLDNNFSPTIYLSTPQEISDGKFSLSYAVDEPEGDPIRLQAQYSLDGGTTWNDAHLYGTVSAITPEFYGEPVIWDALQDLGNSDLTGISFKIRGADVDKGSWCIIDDMSMDTDKIPSAQIIAPMREVSGIVELGVRIADPENDSLRVCYEYSSDGGNTWQTATIPEGPDRTAGTNQFNIFWHSETDLPGFDGLRVRFRATPQDLDIGVAVPSIPFHLDNNSIPSVEIISPEKWDILSGIIPVGFVISDIEFDEILLTLEYKESNSENWSEATGIQNTRLITPAGYSSTLLWNSSADLPAVSNREIDLRIRAVDKDTVFSEIIGPVVIANSLTPTVIQSIIASIDTDLKIIEIMYQLHDVEDRRLAIDITYSFDNGITWSDATISGGFSNIFPSIYSGDLKWHYGVDLGQTEHTVLLRLTPTADDVIGIPRIIEVEF